MNSTLKFIIWLLVALAVCVVGITVAYSVFEKKRINPPTPDQNREAWIADSVNHVRDIRIVVTNNAKIDSLELLLANTRAGRKAVEAQNKAYKADADKAKADLLRERTLANCDKVIEKLDSVITGQQRDIDSLDVEAQQYSEMLTLSKSNADTLFVDNARLEASVIRANATIKGLQQQAAADERRHRNAVFWYKALAVAEGAALLIYFFR